MIKRRLIPVKRTFDHFDRIRSFYLDETKLSPKLEVKRKQYEKAHNLRLTGYSKDQAAKLLLKQNIVSSIQEGYRVCNNSEILFGDVAASNKEGMRVILTENFLRLYQKSMQKENLKEANRALENVAKINALIGVEDPINWNEILIPVPLYSTNPDILKLAQKHDTIDAEIIP